MIELHACPICTSANVAHDFAGHTTRNPADPARWSVSRCADCNHRFVSPQPKWDELSPYYSSSYSPYRAAHGMTEPFTTTVGRARKTGVYRHVSIKPGMRILDVGCGGGSFLRVARELGAHAFGVEPSQHGAEQCRADGLEVFHGMIEDYLAKHGNERFDLITFSHVIEHTSDPVATLRAAGSLLAPDGVLWIAVPNGDCQAMRDLGWRWHSCDLPIHLMHFSLTSARAAADRAGLSVRRLYTHSLPSAVRASMIARLRFRCLIPRRIGKLLITEARATKAAADLDARDEGEAILAELTA